jgi:hypothetical protein
MVNRMLRRILWCVALLSALFALALPKEAAADTCYQYPFDPGTITDPWGCTDSCGRVIPHRGVDFGVACGSAIPAVADGTIVANEHSGCLGWVVAIQHPDGVVSGYAHMPSPSPLPVGTAVVRGQIIGSSGEAGSCAFGCHLHMTMGLTLDSWWTGATFDPIPYIQSHTQCSCDRTDGHFTFSCDGPNDGAHCVSLNEPEDPDSWSDNYLCTPTDDGFVFSPHGPVGGMNCTALSESADAHSAAWSDDYACIPADSSYELAWSAAGALAGYSCVQFNEPADPGTWNDNFLCERPLKCIHAGGFSFCNSGPAEGESCVSVNEPGDPDTWSDNYFCASDAVGGASLGIVWSASGPVKGMTCTNVTEPSDPQAAAWADNYLCLPVGSEYEFSWHNAGPVMGEDCVRWYEAADLHGTWSDNYLCVTRVQHQTPIVVPGAESAEPVADGAEDGATGDGAMVGYCAYRGGAGGWSTAPLFALGVLLAIVGLRSRRMG